MWMFPAHLLSLLLLLGLVEDLHLLSLPLHALRLPASPYTTDVSLRPKPSCTSTPCVAPPKVSSLFTLWSEASPLLLIRQCRLLSRLPPRVVFHLRQHQRSDTVMSAWDRA